MKVFRLNNTLENHPMKVFRLNNVLEESRLSNIRILPFAFGICNFFFYFRKTIAFQKLLVSGKIISWEGYVLGCGLQFFLFFFCSGVFILLFPWIKTQFTYHGLLSTDRRARLQGVNKARWWCQRVSQVPCCSRHQIFEIAYGLFCRSLSLHLHVISRCNTACQIFCFKSTSAIYFFLALGSSWICVAPILSHAEVRICSGVILWSKFLPKW